MVRPLRHTRVDAHPHDLLQETDAVENRDRLGYRAGVYADSALREDVTHRKACPTSQHRTGHPALSLGTLQPSPLRKMIQIGKVVMTTSRPLVRLQVREGDEPDGDVADHRLHHTSVALTEAHTIDGRQQRDPDRRFTEPYYLVGLQKELSRERRHVESELLQCVTG